MRIEGACHCGNMAFDLEWPDDAPVTPRACGCSFCQKHGAEWTAHAQASLRLRIRDGSRASWYRFGTETADFHVLSLIHISEPTRHFKRSRMPSSA